VSRGIGVSRIFVLKKRNACYCHNPCHPRSRAMPDAVRPSLQPVGRRDPRGAMPAASGAALRKRRAMGGDAIVATALLDRPRDPRNSQGDPRGGRLWRVGAAIRPCSIATRAGAFEGPGSARASGSEKLPAARKPVKDKEIPWSPENKGLPETSKDFKRLQKTSKDFKETSKDFQRLPEISKNFQKFPPASGPGRPGGMAGRLRRWARRRHSALLYRCRWRGPSSAPRARAAREFRICVTPKLGSIHRN